MKKIGIITFQNCHNFGANLQAYALNKYLRNENNDVVSVNYLHPMTCNNYLFYTYRQRIIYSNKKSIFFSLFRYIYSIFIKQFIPAVISKNFVNNYIPLSELCYNENNINNLKLNTIVLGSDQIWNARGNFGLDKIYWGQGLNAKVISYAASMGKDKFTDEEEKTVKEFAKSIAQISMREKSNVQYLSELIDRPVYNVCDPVFLLDKSDYSDLAEKSKFKPENKFIFIYNLNNSAYLKEAANKLNKNKEYKIYEVKRNTKVNNYKFIGPLEFLYLIKHADYVLTDSFHGTSLSIIMEKEFYTYISPFGTSRLHTILEKSGLTDREINENKGMNSDKINYEKVQENLNPFIEYSKNYLKENI